MDKFMGKNNPVTVAKYKEATFSTANHWAANSWRVEE